MLAFSRLSFCISLRAVRMFLLLVKNKQHSRVYCLLSWILKTRRDSFDAYGNSRDTTPNFDMLSERGFLFQKHTVQDLGLGLLMLLFSWDCILGSTVHIYITFKEALSLDPIRYVCIINGALPSPKY